jgi:hypothetical protein
MLTSHEVRRIRAKVRILKYCEDPRGFNEVADFAEEEEIYSRVKTKEILAELVNSKSLELKKGQHGSKDQYLTSALGKLEIDRAMQLLEGKLTGAIPIAPMSLTLTFNTSDLPPGIVSEAMFRSHKEILEDPQRSKELATLIGSIVTSYAQQNISDATVAKGAFTADGKFTMVTVFSRGESLRFREVVGSGTLQKGNEVPHLSNLLYVLGTRALLEIYKSHEHGNFQPKTIAATYMGLRIGEDRVFEGHLADLNTLEMARKMKREIETQIKILSSQTDGPAVDEGGVLPV